MLFSRRPSALAILILSFVVAFSAHGYAQESDLLDLVKECDILAAHPADPLRMAEGVSDDRIVPRLAIRACEEAIKEDAKDARFSFQLGRALLASGKKAEAAAEFRKSANAGHAAAWAYLGDALQFGHGQAVDYEKAREAYGKARDGGFEPAAELVNQLNFLPGMYSVNVLAQLYSRDYGGLGGAAKEAERKWITRAYLFAIVQKFVSECDEALPPDRLVSLYLFRYGGGWTNDVDAQTAVGIYSAVADHDARIFLKRHGCESLIAKHVFSSVSGFLAAFKDS